MRDSKKVRGLLACLVWLLLAGNPQSVPARPAEEPHLVFKKSVTVQEYAGGQAYAQPYSVKEGEHLWKILRNQYRMDDAQIAVYVKIARAVNPDVPDLDMLEPRQHILVPFKFVPGHARDNATIAYPDQDVTVVVAEGEHLGKLLRTRYRLPDEIIFSKRTYRLISRANPGIFDVHQLEQGQTLVIPVELFAVAAPVKPAYVHAPAPIPAAPLPIAREHDPPAAGAVEKHARSALGLLAGAFEGAAETSGQAVLPLSDRGAVTLDYATYPVYRFPWGKKIMLDYGSRLPGEVRQVIASEWDTVEIVTVRHEDDLEKILDKVIDAAGFFQVERQSDYIARQGSVQIGVHGDWIIFRDAMMKEVAVVTLVQPGHQTLSPALKSYLSGLGLQMVDIAEDGTPAAAAEPRDHRAAAAEAPAPPQAGRAYLTDLILQAAGISSSRDYTTDIFQNMYTGLSMEVTLDRMFVKNGISHGINFHALPGKIVDIITRQGLELLQLDDAQADAADTAARIAVFCGIEHQPPPAVVRFARGAATGVTLTVPGTLIESGSGRILVSKAELDAEVIDILMSEGIQTLKLW